MSTLAVGHRFADTQLATLSAQDVAAAQHTFKRLVFLARLPLGHDFLTVGKTAYVQALRVCWSTTKASEIRSVCFLNAIHVRKLCRNLNRWIFPVTV